MIYAATATLNHEEKEKKPEKISKVKPFLNKYNCKGINYA